MDWQYRRLARRLYSTKLMERKRRYSIINASGDDSQSVLDYSVLVYPLSDHSRRVSDADALALSPADAWSVDAILPR